MAEKPKTNRKPKTQTTATAASTNGNGNQRPLWERYHRREDDDLNVKIDKPVKNMLGDWARFVTDQVGFEVSVDMAVEDICKEYLFNQIEFQKWLETNGKENSSRSAKAGGENN